MILYNYRYRGPFEYDKFVLNVYQLRNEIKRASKKFKEEENNGLIERKEELDRIIDNLLGRKTGEFARPDEYLVRSYGRHRILERQRPYHED